MSMCVVCLCYTNIKAQPTVRLRSFPIDIVAHVKCFMQIG